MCLSTMSWTRAPTIADPNIHWMSLSWPRNIYHHQIWVNYLSWSSHTNTETVFLWQSSVSCLIIFPPYRENTYPHRGCCQLSFFLEACFHTELSHRRLLMIGKLFLLYLKSCLGGRRLHREQLPTWEPWLLVNYLQMNLLPCLGMTQELWLRSCLSLGWNHIRWC